MLNRLEITWLASYPKSGNTWMRFLLYSYFYGDIRDSHQIGRSIPDIHTLPGNRINSAAVGHHLCKTHFLWGSDHPNASESIRCIYILRHPRDVLLSNLNYFSLLSDAHINAEQFARRFITSLGAPHWKDAGVGNIIENAHSWNDHCDLPGIVIRYEDLLDDTGATLTSVLEFLEIEPVASRVSKAVEASSFSRMKELEDRERSSNQQGFVFQIHPDLNKKDGARFMNRGSKGQALATIHPELDELLEDKFMDYLTQYGYSAAPS